MRRPATVGKDAKLRSHHKGFIVSCPNGVRTGDGNGEETRMSPNLVRLSGLAAILGGVLGVLLTPVLAYLWATDSAFHSCCAGGL